MTPEKAEYNWLQATCPGPWFMLTMMAIPCAVALLFLGVVLCDGCAHPAPSAVPETLPTPLGHRPSLSELPAAYHPPPASEAPLAPAVMPQKSPIRYVAVFFDVDSAELPPGTGANALALFLEDWRPVTVSGHCDERGSDAYNMRLGQRRADAVKAEIVRLGAPAEQIRAVSFGKRRPIEVGHNDAAWLMNRRVEVTR